MPSICPYPGLRPFAEEESIFFKGRDLHIRQIVKLLETNKMAFITGASGDGKSSMVYAGVIPYIRAGFFKSHFNSWLIVDFKPQRNPLKSITDAAAAEFGIENSNCADQLELGFSSLTDLYKQSGYYVTDHPDAINKGKNLLIIADQFEEIFTNAENFNAGQPSDESYTAINLLLETVRISIAEKLPVYVIFTMRSDFISQCTVFKNLPEFIAYSQFFVPQLKRDEIRQVIEEPAVLAGGSVSSRLTEVLINNLNSGFDQLPVLQHALNLLWKMADNGAQQLDLIHLAKIAGISKDVLSDQEQKEFDKWFKSRPEYERKYFVKPDLNNVLNAHAGILYESAYDYFNQNAFWAQKNITPDESKEIIKTAFKCLTKIDNNRPVRNRCTLNEITGIVNRDHITNATVCGVINIFRSPENTLLRPFIVDNALETKYLSGDTVLDVTHEALIRNWKLLTAWDAEEESFTKDYYDFNSQLHRWLQNDRKPQFLLTSGSLSYFDTWYQNCNPNPYWLAKYDNSKLPEKQKLKEADIQYQNIGDYITASDNAVKAEERARRRRIRNLIIGAAAFVVFLIAFSSWALHERVIAQNERDRANEQTELAKQQRDTAEMQKQKAIKATEEAEQERKKAEDAAAAALVAQKETQIAYDSANAARLLADQMKDEAIANLHRAEDERKRADSARNNADIARKNAEMEKERAETANNIALSSTLAMKAKSQYEDKNLSIRLAYEAYRINKGNRNNADLYDAMLYALEENGFNNALKTTSEPIRAFKIDNSNRLLIATSSAQVIGYKMVGGRPLEYLRISKYESAMPVHCAYFLSDKYLIYSTKDKNSYIIDIATQKQYPVSLKGDYINAAILMPDNKHIAVAYNNGNFYVFDTENIKAQPIVNHDFSSKIIDICHGGNNDVYVLLHSGILQKINILDSKTKTILNDTHSNAFGIANITDKNTLAVCFADGNIHFVNSLTDTKIEGSMLGGHSKLEKILYDPHTQILALTSADKRVSFIDTKDINAKPLTIEEHGLYGYKVRYIDFNSKGMFFALTDENVIRYWDTDINQYAKTLESMNLAPLTEEEKKLILGPEFTQNSQSR